ncbi:Outer membrane protein beta-barrel domain-containing protein [Belliella buryatensis]|uniref:Outer membrane protein beta-barrel domain-containing protein n=1 Tax=Belliella buryatensis TaxID=1500549 RepID=A0A239B3G6_9BACT|nr:outer membrane beta-barrel protein [Belliella buryatensis]SNS02360.1 Outer membrane protein beta-barrel domain-containing protein [Belliella buryatensis]
MKEQFDKKLSNKIKSTFEDHQEPFDPQAWKSFSAAYFKTGASSGRSVWKWWLSGIAASISLAFIVFALLPTGDFLENGHQVNENKLLTQGDLTDTINAKNDDIPQDKEINKTVPADSPKLVNKQRLSDSDKNIDPISNNLANASSKAEQPHGSLIQNNKDDLLASNQKIEKVPDFKFVSPDDSLKQISLIGLKLNASNPAKLDLMSSKLMADESQLAEKTIQKWLEEAANADDRIVDNQSQQNFRLGLLLAPQSISNATQNLNIGAGLMSELSFSNRLKLDLGLSYARHSMNPAVNSQVIAANSDFVQAADSRLANFSNNFVNASYELSFGQLELPINLKYKIIERDKADIYLITGVSNMVYLNQRNTGTFTTANFSAVGLMTGDQTIQRFTETATPSDVTDGTGSSVGQLLNLSFGYEHNLKNGTFLSLEPFYKMSLGGQTFINQQFGIGGLNLRMNFQFKK